MKAYKRKTANAQRKAYQIVRATTAKLRVQKCVEKKNTTQQIESNERMIQNTTYFNCQ